MQSLKGPKSHTLYTCLGNEGVPTPTWPSHDILGSLSNNDGERYVVQFAKCWQIFLTLNSKRLYQSSGREKESRCHARPPQNVKIGTFTW